MRPVYRNVHKPHSLGFLVPFEALNPLKLFHNNQRFKALMGISLYFSLKSSQIHLRVVPETIFYPYHMCPSICGRPEWAVSVRGEASGSLTEAAEPLRVLGY